MQRTFCPEEVLMSEPGCESKVQSVKSQPTEERKQERLPGIGL